MSGSPDWLDTKNTTQAIIDMHSITKLELNQPTWQKTVMLVLGFWLSASLILDWVIMPSLYLSGMMSQASFTAAGYVIFWFFNRLELILAALILTGVLAIAKTQSQWRLSNIFLSVLLLGIALLDTYLLTPQMCAVGMDLNLFASVSVFPSSMNLLHGGYFLLDFLKLVTSGLLVNWCWRQI